MPGLVRILIISLLLGGCATPFQKRAAHLDAVRLDVTAFSTQSVLGKKESTPLRIDDDALATALRTGIEESVGSVWLPFAVEARDEAPAPVVVAVRGGPARMWQSEDGAMLLDWPVQFEVLDENGTRLLERPVACVDRVVFPVDVLIAAKYPPPPDELAGEGSPAMTPTWRDPQRAYESLARWCGRTVVETLAMAAR